MKYIRTKNGVYEVSELNEYATHHKSNKTLIIDKYIDRYILNKTILAQADTIEELCDEFVVIFEDKNHIVYSEFKWAMDKAMWSGMPFIIYGAIWTDKGLKYIAKLNEEGRLELI